MTRLVACCFAWLLPLLAFASPTSRNDPAHEIIRRTLGPTSILSDLQELTDDIGGRPSGSVALSQAIVWGIDKFRAAGLVNVRSEPYTVPILWLPGVESGAIIRPNSRKLAVVALPFSSGTGAFGIEAEVTSVGHGEDSDFVRFKDKLLGRWVLIETVPMRSNEDLDAEYINAPRIFLTARNAGAVGILWMSTRSGRLLYRHPVRFDDTIDPLPGAMLDREDALRISRAVTAGKDVRVKVVTEPHIMVNVVLANVVGEVRGYASPAESVVLGAHLDSWDLGQGALDNGCNAVLVIDAARQIATVARAHPPRRTIRFVLFTGEEAGFLGSRADARLHRAELDQIVR